MTQELARDLTPELIAMLKHSRPQVRRRAVLALYKLAKKNPDIISTIGPRLEDKLEDLDPCAYSLVSSVEFLLKRFIETLFSCPRSYDQRFVRTCPP